MVIFTSKRIISLKKMGFHKFFITTNTVMITLLSPVNNSFRLSHRKRLEGLGRSIRRPTGGTYEMK